MTLRQKQSRFCLLVADLIQYAHAQRYQVTFGEAYRSPEEAQRLFVAGKGIKTSLHTQRLAMDLNLFKDGRYLTNLESYRPLGDFWESLSRPDAVCCWGGRFTSGDANHFSIEHGGRK